jgi:hypothetical protein
MRVYVRIRGRVTGPFDGEQLQAFRARGQLLAGHEVSADGVSWTPASTLPGLFPVLEGSQPGPGMVGTADVRNLPPPLPAPRPVVAESEAEASPADEVRASAESSWAGWQWPRFSPPAWALLAATGAMVLLAVVALIAAGRYAALQDGLEKQELNRRSELDKRETRLAQREIDVEEKQRQLDRRDSQLTQLEQQLDVKQRSVTDGEKKVALGQQEIESRQRDLTRQTAENQARRERLDKQEQDLAQRRQELEESKKKRGAAEKPSEPEDKKKEAEAPALDADSKAEAQRLLRQVRQLVHEYRLSRVRTKRLDVMELCREIKVRFPNTEYARQAEAFRKQILEIDRE